MAAVRDGALRPTGKTRAATPSASVRASEERRPPVLLPKCHKRVPQLHACDLHFLSHGLENITYGLQTDYLGNKV